MITINQSWSLGLCPNKSLEAFESPVRPRQGDHLTSENDRLSVPTQIADSPVRSGVPTRSLPSSCQFAFIRGCSLVQIKIG
jgi:hypothetical protein